MATAVAAAVAAAAVAAAAVAAAAVAAAAASGSRTVKATAAAAKGAIGVLSGSRISFRFMFSVALISFLAFTASHLFLFLPFYIGMEGRWAPRAGAPATPRHRFAALFFFILYFHLNLEGFFLFWFGIILLSGLSAITHLRLKVFCCLQQLWWFVFPICGGLLGDASLFVSALLRIVGNACGILRILRKALDEDWWLLRLIHPMPFDILWLPISRNHL